MMATGRSTSQTKLVPPEPRKLDQEIESDLQYAMEINRWHLKLLGIWPLSPTSSTIEKVLMYFIIMLYSALLAFIIIPGCLLTFVKIKDPGIRLRLAGPLSFCVMAIMKYLSLVMGRQNIANSLEHIVADWRRMTSLTDRNIMINHAQYGRYGSVICAGFTYGGAFFFAGILPHVSAPAMSDSNVTIKPLAYPSYFIWFDPQQSPAYEAVYSVHCCCAFVMHSITSASCSLAVTFVMHARGQLKIMIVWLQDLVEGTESRDEFPGRLSRIILQHVRTIGFIANIETMLCGICFVELVGCTLNICLLGYYFMLEWEETADAVELVTWAILFISFVFNIFCFCYVGELLTEECRNVGEASYMIDWYYLSGKEALGLTLTIATAQTPIALTAGKLFDLSLNCFATVIRTSLTYLNLLRKFME